jgi:hypothetical protein
VVQRLTDVQQQTRLAWAKALVRKYPESDPFWRTILFSDETKRGTSDMDQTAWVFPGENRAERQKSRWDAKIHVWGYIGTGGVRCIRNVSGHTVTKETYLALLKETLGRRQWVRSKHWQQDNATAHTAKSVVKWLAKNAIPTLDNWPPNSPDLSPIENLWGRMWADAMKLRPTNMDELWTAVDGVFRGYDDEYIDGLVLSFRKRLLMCIEANGGTIGAHY